MILLVCLYLYIFGDSDIRKLSYPGEGTPWLIFKKYLIVKFLSLSHHSFSTFVNNIYSGCNFVHLSIDLYYDFVKVHIFSLNLFPALLFTKCLGNQD